MNRRGFLKLLGGMVGGVALEAAIPFGRVYSFPAEIKPLNLAQLATIYYGKRRVDALKYNMVFKELGRAGEQLGFKRGPIMTDQGLTLELFQQIKSGFEANHPDITLELVTA